MGLTASGTGFHLKHGLSDTDYDINVTLSGNPNVGKSSIFNLLTGLHQHTGNWSGKTVETAQGTYSFSGKRVLVTDLPGCYSLDTRSHEEEVAKQSILKDRNTVSVVVCDAALLCRNLNLFFQVAAKNKKVILCVNLTDEAAKHGIFVDTKLLAARLKVPVISTCAKNGKGIEALKSEIEKCADINLANRFFGNVSESAEERIRLAEKICDGVITRTEKHKAKILKADRILTSKSFGLPFMFLMLMLLFWLTISVSNYPSQLLSAFFTRLENPFYSFLCSVGLPVKLCEMLVFGIYRVVGFIVSVMLPPMSIFFPLFSLTEDLGLLPRIAFNMDRCFKKCNTCGKQCLTMCMGLGCNAAGVVGARIIDSPRERLIAVITNSLVPCNGRFPTLIAMISLFFVVGGGGFSSSFFSAAILALFIMLSILMTLLSSFLLSKTFLKGEPSSFSLELPPYRKPKILKTILHSVFDRVLFVLSRALISAIPAGAVIWLLANFSVGGSSLLQIISEFLDPIGRFFGLDGTILLGFILGMPANEIVIPIIMLTYLKNGLLTDIADLQFLKTVFLSNGWTSLTALNLCLFSLFHWPCTTTLLTIKKETDSAKITLISFLLPTVIGLTLCLITRLIFG